MSGRAELIRPVERQDAVKLAALVRDLGEFSSVTREVPDATLARVRDHLEVIVVSDRHTLLVAEDDGNLVGYCSVHWIPMMSRLSGYISELFVVQARRGEGIGSRLLEDVETEARARGCGRLHLENFRTKASYRRSYYAKKGWQEREAAASFVLELQEKLP